MVRASVSAVARASCQAFRNLVRRPAQQFGGLWYSILRDRENGMEYALEECTVFQTGFGPAFGGIMDGAWTWPVDILHDGRTLMRLGGHISDRVIDSSVIQRIEGHAQLSVAGHWPHHRYSLAVPAGTEPTVNAGAFPPVVPEATGPASRWWFDGDRAVLLRLKRWWVRRPPRRHPRRSRYRAGLVRHVPALDAGGCQLQARCQ